MLDLIIPINGLGNFITVFKLFGKISLIDLFITLFGILYCVLPWDEIVRKVFNLKVEDDNQNYIDAHK